MLHLYYTPVSPLLDFVNDFWLYDGYTQPHFKERIALAAVADETRKAVIQSLSSRLRVLIHAAIGGVLLSDFDNTRLLSKSGAPPYGIVYAVKMAVSLTVFVIAILITSGKPGYAGFQANWEGGLG